MSFLQWAHSIIIIVIINDNNNNLSISISPFSVMLHIYLLQF